MTKKLNGASITNDLEGSSFFPTKKQSPPLQQNNSPIPEEPKKLPETDRATARPSDEATWRPSDRPTGKRVLVRRGFEWFGDQLEDLKKLSLRDQMEGKSGSMSAMLREALDAYLEKRANEK